VLHPLTKSADSVSLFLGLGRIGQLSPARFATKQPDPRPLKIKENRARLMVENVAGCVVDHQFVLTIIVWLNLERTSGLEELRRAVALAPGDRSARSRKPQTHAHFRLVGENGHPHSVQQSYHLIAASMTGFSRASKTSAFICDWVNTTCMKWARSPHPSDETCLTS
jgi:hypothetical protein